MSGFGTHPVTWDVFDGHLMRGIGSSEAVTEDQHGSLVTGTLLGAYRIEGLLGAGGMGEVYRAHDTRLGRTVALKVLHPASFANPESKRRFLQEAQAASALNHPNIVTLHDIASDGDRDFLVLEHVAGRPLSETIPPGGLSIDDMLRYGIQIAGALAAAHASGIAHRDIKPANIMVAPDSHVKVLDFGVATLMDAVGAGVDGETGPPRTMTGRVVGTVSYMSPEQTRGAPVDGRSDLFSLGLVLYEMTTGRRFRFREHRSDAYSSRIHSLGSSHPLGFAMVFRRRSTR